MSRICCITGDRVPNCSSWSWILSSWLLSVSLMMARSKPLGHHVSEYFSVVIEDSRFMDNDFLHRDFHVVGGVCRCLHISYHCSFPNQLCEPGPQWMPCQRIRWAAKPVVEIALNRQHKSHSKTQSRHEKKLSEGKAALKQTQKAWMKRRKERGETWGEINALHMTNHVTLWSEYTE